MFQELHLQIRKLVTGINLQIRKLVTGMTLTKEETYLRDNIWGLENVFEGLHLQIKKLHLQIRELITCQWSDMPYAGNTDKKIIEIKNIIIKRN